MSKNFPRYYYDDNGGEVIVVKDRNDPDEDIALVYDAEMADKIVDALNAE